MKNLTALSLLFFFAFLVSCNNGSPDTGMTSPSKDSTSTALSDTTSATGLTGNSIKLVKTASVNFKVQDVNQSIRAVSELAQKFGGMIYHQDMQSAERERKELKISADSLAVITTVIPRADILVRVPSENLEEFMYRVAGLGYFTGSSQLNIDDKSLSYLESQLKQQNRKELLSQHDAKKSKSPTGVQTIDIKDDVIAQQINNLAINADTHYSTVNLSLFQNPVVRKEVIVNYIISDYQLPFVQRLGNALKDGWQYFLAFMMIVAELWIFILLALIILLSYKRSQQKRTISA